MKEKIIRIFAWYTLILFLILSFVLLILILTEKFDIFYVLSFFICIGIALNGFFTRRYSLPNFILTRLSKFLTILSLLVGSFFCLYIPIVFMKLYGFEESILSLFTLLLLFIPSFIISIFLLITSFKTK